MRCPRGRRFLASTRKPNGLETALNRGISDIRKTIFQNSVTMFSFSSYFLRALGGAGFYVQSRIYEVPSKIWHLNFPTHLGAHGVYDQGKILLREGNWCYKTLYHEVLHSMSIFSTSNVYSTIGRRYLFLSEGLTEFLTGYYLYKRKKQCYKAWESKTYKECALNSHKRQVKLWGAFCNFIKIEGVLKLYFWDGTRDWNQKYIEFLTAIHNQGYPNFRDALSMENNAEILFTQECINNFGKDFQDILDSRKSLDFTHVKV